MMYTGVTMHWSEQKYALICLHKKLFLRNNMILVYKVDHTCFHYLKKKNSCLSYKRSKWKITDTESELKYPGDNIKLLTVGEQSNRLMERLLLQPSYSGAQDQILQNINPYYPHKNEIQCENIHLKQIL